MVWGPLSLTVGLDDLVRGIFHFSGVLGPEAATNPCPHPPPRCSPPGAHRGCVDVMGVDICALA